MSTISPSGRRRKKLKLRIPQYGFFFAGYIRAQPLPDGRLVYRASSRAPIEIIEAGNWRWA